MSIQAKKIVVVSEGAMQEDALYRAMKNASASKVAERLQVQSALIGERTEYESNRERQDKFGNVYVGQSNDIAQIQALEGSEAFARLSIAIKLDDRAYLFPQSQASGKLSTQTSNLKAYKKAREIAETIYIGGSIGLENVVKVFFACCVKVVATSNGPVISRTYGECFLNSPEFRSIYTGAQELFDAIEDTRANAKHMSNGAPTQTSQMIRTLVALGVATDVQNGRSKDFRFNAESKVALALSRRLGLIEGPTADLSDLIDA